MNTRPASSWKTFGILACTLAFTASMQAQTTVKILTTDPTALEGTSSGAFTLVRVGDTNSDLTVNLDISGTASNGVDYATISNAVIIPAGYLAIDVPVQPIIDTVTRGNKTVVLAVDTNGAYTVAGRGYGTVTIVDDVFNVPPPTVTLTTPADGSVFTSPAVITMSADAESDLPIQRVCFYQDDKLLATVSNAPYTFVWTNPANGNHNLFARAVDSSNKAGVSDTASITVSATPVVTVVSPEGNEVYDDQLIPLQVQIGDTNEPIQSVSFYVNKKLIGTSTTAPFIVYWSDTANGSFNITAVATDANTSLTGTSPKFVMTVIPPVVGGD